MQNCQNSPIRWVLPVAFFLLCGFSTVIADDNEGFTEPRYHIQVAAAETGIVKQLDVREGDAVSAGQVLGVLDDDILEASLEIAKKSREAQGAILSAKAELTLKTERLRQYQELRKTNHASAEEVDRAQTEKDVAEARLLAATEAQDVKELEYQRAKVQLARRRILSPIDGVVIEVHKELGEFVSPNDAVVFTVVQLNPLLATFSIPLSDAANLSKGQRARVGFDDGSRTALGTIVFVSPVINAQSSTVKVKVEIPNADGQWKSGARCSLVDAPVATQLGLRR